MQDTRSMNQQMQDFLQEKTPEEIEAIIRRSTEMMSYYRCAMMEIETKFRVLNEQFSLEHERNPIDSITTRLKSFPSIAAKLVRKHQPVNLSAMQEYLSDIAGVRVICAFEDDIYLLADCLLEQDDVRLVTVKDYIREPKENGYRSLHLIVEIPIFLSHEKRFVRVEVQLRTIAMESWANLEHRLRYKKRPPSPLLAETIAAELQECAHMSRELDHRMQRIRNLLEEDA